ncbi:hypothetical protein MFIFM68171_11321 [Madurella fahalii]|uniref:Protein kinase domain-containing protein n=1 Tax=Madurella fahalii TaxID=1157608 RepID=A0ABQ0GTN8_9PEZI
MAIKANTSRRVESARFARKPTLHVGLELHPRHPLAPPALRLAAVVGEKIDVAVAASWQIRGAFIAPFSHYEAILGPSTQQTGGDKVKILGRLLQTLEDNQVPGPQFFRLHQGFSTCLGEGGQGNVRGIDEAVAKRYDKAENEVRSKWPVRLIAIKQYQHSKNKYDPQPPTLSFAAGDGNGSAAAAAKARADNELTGRFRAADSSARACVSTLRPSPTPTSLATRAPIFLWKLLVHWTGLMQDPCETVRLLCIDIGHGLGSLHDHGFTHGDLKPNNVLIFQLRGADGRTSFVTLDEP